MAHLAKLWAGNLFGTNTGKLFAEFNLSGEEVSGTVRYLDDSGTLVVYSVKGKFDGSKLAIDGEPSQTTEGVEFGNIKALANLTPEGLLRGRWDSTLGTAGTFQLFPHQDPNAPPPVAPGPRELHTVVRQLGVVRLGQSEVRALIRLMLADYTSGQLLITFEHQGSERTIYAVDLEQRTAGIGPLHRFRLQIQEPEGSGVNRILAVELDSKTGNIIRAQSAQEAWAVGKAETIARLLQRYQVRFATWLKRSGLVFFLFLGALLILSPAIANGWTRAAFVGSFLVLFYASQQLLMRLIPDAVVFLSRERQSLLLRAWPALVGALITIATSVISALIYGWLSGSLF